MKCKKCGKEFSDSLNECPRCNEHMESSETSESPVDVPPISINMFDEPVEESIDTRRSNREKISDSGDISQPRFRISPITLIAICVIVLVVIIISSSRIYDIYSSFLPQIKQSVVPPTSTALAGGTPTKQGVMPPTTPAGKQGVVPPTALAGSTPAKLGAVPPTVPVGVPVSGKTKLQFTDAPIITTGNPHPVLVSIVQGSDGNMWFTDNSNEIGKVTPDGKITEVALTNVPDGGVAYPDGITSGPDGNIWFTMVAKAYIGRVNLKAPFTASAFTYLNLPSAQDQGGTGITTGPDGNLWYVLAGNSATTHDAKIGCITVTRTSCGEYDLGIGVNPSIRVNPSSIISTGGKLWFTEFGNNSIGWLTPGPNATPHIISLPGIQPFNMASEPNGEIWFTEPNVGKLGHISASGTLLTQIPLNIAPESITIGSDGTIWLTVWPVGVRQPGGNIESLSSDGKRITSYSSFPTACVPAHNSDEYDNGNGITVASNGQIWFTEPEYVTATPMIGHSL